MKKSLLLTLVAGLGLGLGACTSYVAGPVPPPPPPGPPVVTGASIVVATGDRPYYVHGPGYWVGRRHYVWVPGHWIRRNGVRVWVHGHYRG